MQDEDLEADLEWFYHCPRCLKRVETPQLCHSCETDLMRENSGYTR